MPMTKPIDTSLVEAITQFVDALHQHYSGIKAM
jgi:hypothetical protein